MPPDERFDLPLRRRAAAGALPYGRWAETLQAEFLAACLRDRDRGRRELGEAGEIHWFPDRTWSGRTYVPATARTDTGLELFGYVSFAPGDDGASRRLLRAGPTTPPTPPSDNPDWRMDICQEVVGGWRGERGEVAAMTLIWGVPLERGGARRDRRARRPRPSTSARSPRTASRCSPPTPTATTTSTSCSRTAPGTSWRASRSTRTTTT